MFVFPQFILKVECATFNHAPYIVETMNGFCMQQSNFPYVCVIMDDASTDGEQQIIDNYLHDFFDLQESFNGEKDTDDYILKIARHKTNLNCYFAVYFLKYNHYSIKKDKRSYDLKVFDDVKYIATCEGDDYWTDASKLQKQIDFLESHSDYVLCCHETKRYNQNTGELYYQKHDVLNSHPEGFSFDRHYNGWLIQTLTNVFRANFEGYETFISMKNRYDIIFYYFIGKAGKCFLMPDIMSVYRIHDGGICSGASFVSFYFTLLDAYNELCEVDKSIDARNLLRNQIQNNIGNLIFLRAWKAIIKSLKITKKHSSTWDFFKFLFRLSYSGVSQIANSLYNVLRNKFLGNKKI